MLDTTKPTKQLVNITLVFDDKTERPRVRLEIGTWYSVEFLPTDTFFKVCTQYWVNNVQTN